MWAHQAALETLDRAIRAVESMQSHFYEPEIVRLRGEALLQQSAGNWNEAAAVFRRSIEISRRQACRTLELRGATSLARLLGDQGRAADARDLLTSVHGSFTEGFHF